MEIDSDWDENGKSPECFELWLYVAGKSLNSLQTLGNLKKICKEHLHGNCRIKVIDLRKNPECAKKSQISAIPTLIIKLPENGKRVIGNLADTEKVLAGLDIP
ncbi:MAG: circadian clock KaiB family protein [Methanobacterium sp.]